MEEKDKFYEALRPFKQEWPDHCGSADSMYALYRQIQAPYKLLKHCYNMLEGKFSAVFGGFMLLPRGSFARQTALKGYADLDLDLILPRSYKTFEKMEQKCGTDCNVEPFSRLCISLDNKIYEIFDKGKSFLVATIIQRNGVKDEEKKILLPFDIGLKAEQNEEKMSRSIKYDVYVHGVKVEVDIFPKLLDKNGKVRWLSHEDHSGKRNWLSWSLLNREKKITFKDEQTAAILFVKLWRAQRKEASENAQMEDKEKEAEVEEKEKEDKEKEAEAEEREKEDKEREAKAKDLKKAFNRYEFLKGYHIALAMERIVEQEDENEQEPRQAEEEDGPIFDHQKVIQYMIQLLDYLIAAYDPTNGQEERFQFSSVGGNPFQMDTEAVSEKRGEIIAALGGLKNFITTPLPVPEVGEGLLQD